MSDKILDASKETQKATSRSQYDQLNYVTSGVIDKKFDSISYDYIITDNIELCLNKSKIINDQFVSFDELKAKTCLQKLNKALVNNY